MKTTNQGRGADPPAAPGSRRTKQGDLFSGAPEQEATRAGPATATMEGAKTEQAPSQRESPAAPATLVTKRRAAARPARPPRRTPSPRGEVHISQHQREISVSEFFTKNRHLLGFDNPKKALLTAVKEGLDNALDACEEARILPEVLVRIERISPASRDTPVAQPSLAAPRLRKGRQTGSSTPSSKPRKDIGAVERYRVIIEDNGPGIVKAQVPNIFAKLLYGSKFHRLRQSRGQQGIGISAAGMYGQLTTGEPIQILSRIGPRKPAHHFRLRIDTAKNRPEILTDKEVPWDRPHGTRIEIVLEGRHQKGKGSVDEYVKFAAVSNPHLELRYTGPDDTSITFARGTRTLPAEPREIPPHPHGLEFGTLQRMLRETRSRTIRSFLSSELARISSRTALAICRAGGVDPDRRSSRAKPADIEGILRGIRVTRILAPPTDCLSPLGEALILAGLRKEVEADFYTAVTRSPSVYRGNPFQVEVGIAYGRAGETARVDARGKIVPGSRARSRAKDHTDLLAEADEPFHVLRFANRVPLIYQQSACAISKATVATHWKAYGVSQPRGGLPVGRGVLLVHFASVWVPFTSESKEAIASYPEILKEIRLALMDAGRKLGTFLRKGARVEAEWKKRTYIEKYLPHIGIGLQEILGFPDPEREKIVATLKDTLERTRKI